MRYLVSVSFDGTNYAGFQKQNNAIAIQEVIEKAIKNMISMPFKIYGSGRTDRGVHAKDLTFHFDSDLDISTEQWTMGLNKQLPFDIRINWVKEVASNFHARYHAISRIYEYKIAKSLSDVFSYNYEVYIENFDITKAKAALKYFIGTKDFRNFSKSTIEQDTIRTISEFTLNETYNHYIFTIKGNSFLRYMVRSIVGTIIDIATNKKAIESIEEIFKEGNRKLAGKTAESRGLYLKKTNYSRGI